MHRTGNNREYQDADDAMDRTEYILDRVYTKYKYMYDRDGCYEREKENVNVIMRIIA